MTARQDGATPGPWHSEFGYVFAGKNCIAICDTDNASPDVYAANARLMASAQDMLDALRAVRMTLLADNPKKGGLNEASRKRAYAIAQDAIAKAEGK